MISRNNSTSTTPLPRIFITGAGHAFPDTVLDNAFFETLNIDTTGGWIEDRVGIRERRSILTREDIMQLRHGTVTRAELLAQGRIKTIAALAKEPWDMVLERSNLQKRGVAIDQVVAGTSVPDWNIPANACAVAESLGLECAAFDCNSACSTFVVNLHVARGLLQARASKTAAIFNVERYTTRVDYADRSSCVLFGDSATAVILEANPSAPRGLELIDTYVDSSPSGYEQIRLPDGGVFTQNGKAVQKFATNKTIAATQEILSRNNLTTTDITYFIAHQANLRMLTYTTEKLGLTAEQHLYNVDYYGNQGATGAPSVLSMHWEKYKSGDLIVISVVGSGLTWGSALLRCV